MLCISKNGIESILLNSKGLLNQHHTKKLFSNCNFVCELEYNLLNCLNIEPLN